MSVQRRETESWNSKRVRTSFGNEKERDNKRTNTKEKMTT